MATRLNKLAGSGSGPARVPPHNLEAEESVLGACMLSRQAIATALETVVPDDFYKPAHAEMFRIMLDLYARGEPIDAVTLGEELRRQGNLDEFGGKPYLFTLVSSVPSPGAVGHYARIVQENATLRRLIEASQQISDLAFALPDDVEQAVDQAEDLVYQVTNRRVSEDLVILKDLLTENMEMVEKLYERGSAITGVATGFNDLDDLTAGLQPSNLIIVAARPSMGKALALDTPIPTPEGRMSMGEIGPGAEVLDERGQVCRVIHVSPIYTDHDCYEVEFDDGSVIVADGGHQWLAWEYPGWHAKRRVVTTAQMLAGGVRVRVRLRARRTDHPRWWVPLSEPLDLPEHPVAADPYVLGCRLGNLYTTGEPRGEREHAHFAGEFEAAGTMGWPLAQPDDRIDDAYLRGSFKQRLALLQGLMDTEGVVQDRGWTVELSLRHRGLLAQARELVCSLGHKPGPIREHAPDPGEPATAWRFRWNPLDPVFRLAAKADALAAANRRGRPMRRGIVAIRPVPPVPVRCIEVDSPSHLYLAGDSMIPTHNSALALSIAQHVATNDKVPVVIFSLEMSRMELVQRLMCSEARVDSNRLRRGALQDSDWPKLSLALGRLAEAPIFIDDTPNATIMEMRAKCRRVASKNDGLGLVIIDYLQLMAPLKRTDNRVQEVSEISRSLKILARELEVPVIALSQLSRNVEYRADKRPLLADLRESGCMPASTRLMRADGREVTLGELVLSQDQPLVWSLDESWKLVPTRLTKAFPSGIKPVFRLRLRSGYEVEATGNHQFRTVDGWVPLDELLPGTAVAVPRIIPFPVEQTPAWDESELILLAHLLGDGSIAPGVKYATADPANKEIVESAALSRFGIKVEGEVPTVKSWQLWFPSPYRLTHNRHHPMREWLEPLGLWGSRSNNKFVPEEVFGLSDRQIALFLKHLWATDGSVTIGRNARGPLVTVYYSTNSRRLADGVRRLLLRLDIRSVLGVAKKAGYSDGWHVRIQGAEGKSRFLSEVGCHGERGECIPAALEILAGIKPNPNVDLVPWEANVRVKHSLVAASMTHRGLAAALNERYCGSYLLGSETRRRRFSRSRLAQMAAATGDATLAALAASDVYFDEIAEITPLGAQPTFDATVEGTHNFIANGIVAHNSIEQDADVVMFIYRDEVYHPDSPQRGIAELHISKHRSGPIGKVELTFLEHYTKFANLARGM